MTAGMKGLLCSLLVLPVLAAEGIAYFWMNPRDPAVSPAYPVLPPLTEDAAFKYIPQAYDDVKDQLFCSNGWMGNLGAGGDPVVRLGWFEWDKAGSTNTLEAFKHLPESCMGSAGMKLQKIHKPRVYGEGDRTMVFDSTYYQPPGGGMAVYTFKAVWVSGRPGMNLRSDVIDGLNMNSLRTLRFSIAKHRFSPVRTRVMLGSVSGLPTEELAWKWFRQECLEKIHWTEEKPGSGA